MQPGEAAAERTFIETARRAQIVAAAIDTIAEVGYANASLAQIAQRLGISRGLISYHFANKDELITEVGREVITKARAYMEPRIMAESTGRGMLRVYIESNLEFMREHRNHLIAIVDIIRHKALADDQPRPQEAARSDEAVQLLEQLLARFQAAGEFRPDFDPRALAIAIRAAIDAVPPRFRRDPDFDIDGYAATIATLFDLGTRPLRS